MSLRKCLIYSCVITWCCLIDQSLCETKVNEEHSHMPELCPGLYCGRVKLSDGNYTACGACPHGWRADNWTICRLCVSEPLLYDWLYLGFMVMLSLSLQFFFIDFTNKRKSRGLIVLAVSAFVESVLAALCTLLLVEPKGSLRIRSCLVRQLSDWYTMLYNPSPGYTSTLHCTHEAVYPLYTIVMIFYAFSVVFMMIFRALLSCKFVSGLGTKSIYASLYLFPILVVVQATLGGLLYYSFPYIVIVLSLITSAIHYSQFREQDIKSLIKWNFTKPRNLAIVAGHWILHAYGVISITQLQIPAFHVPLLAVVPFPTLFYLLTVHMTDPEKLETV